MYPFSPTTLFRYLNTNILEKLIQKAATSTINVAFALTVANIVKNNTYIDDRICK